MYRLLIFSAQARHRPPHDFGQYTGAALLTNGLKIKLSTGLNPNVSHGTIHRWTTGIHQCRRGMRFPRSLVSEFKKRVSGFCHPTKSQIDIDWLVEREVDRREVTPSYSMVTARLGYCPPPVDGSILLSVPRYVHTQMDPLVRNTWGPYTSTRTINNRRPLLPRSSPSA